MLFHHNLTAPPDEEHVIPSPVAGCRLFLRYLPSPGAPASAHNVVLYVHGATFPSALSIAHRFDGRSWGDVLREDGFHVWGLDFHGYGKSDPYAEMEEAANANAPLGRAEVCARQIAAAVDFIAAYHGVARINLIAHSWGTIVAGRFAMLTPERIERLVFFGPIAQRDGGIGSVPTLPAWRLMTEREQWARFVEDVPPGEAPMFDPRHFEQWVAAYLATYAASAPRAPRSVKMPTGPIADIAAAWNGALAYDPSQITAPVAIVRGAWDSLTTDADARWLFDGLTAARARRDLKIDRATHLMHLEKQRFALYAQTTAFLREELR
jgi:pimeloyl-ACP methyl ester carboxylesterase